MTYSTMAEYYAQQNILPTEAHLQDWKALTHYAYYRERFLNDKLYLPKRLFKNADLIEFGPDSGENAMAFAVWGAQCTLVEPNPRAHAVIKDYFNRYLYSYKSLEQADIKEYAQRDLQETYDFAVAEGFIYTVQPASMWVNMFSRLLRPNGFALISYMEKSGSYIEVLTRRIYNRVKELTGKPGIEVAHILFDKKWTTIPHTRTFESWVMDVLENPFVCEQYFLDANDICCQFEAAGMRLYSSWPQYRGIDVYWHKAPEPEGNRARFIETQRNIWAFGPPRAGGKLLAATVRDLLVLHTAQPLIEFCQTNGLWLRLWGQPLHFAVFQKE